MRIPDKKLIVIGGSHAVIWGGGLFGESAPVAATDQFHGVDVRHLGSGLAYHLLDADGLHLGKIGLRVFDNLLSTPLDNTAAVMLCFGESDIRTEVIRQARHAGISIETSSKKVAQRLLKFSELLHDKIDKPIFIWAPLPTANSFFPRYSASLPYVGSPQERNFATQVFFDELQHGEKEFKDKPIYSFGIISDLMNQLLLTNPDYYVDGCHLNHKGMQLAIQAFQDVAKAHGYSFPNFFLPKTLALTYTTKRVVDIRIQHMSSILEEAEHSLDSDPTKSFIFSTDHENHPLVLLQLSYAAFVSKIELFNRRDGHYDRAKHLTVAVGNDLENLTVVHQQNGAWGEGGEPLVINPSNEPPFSFIALYLTDANYLQLSDVHVYETNYLHSL